MAAKNDERGEVQCRNQSFANKRALGAIYLPQNEVDWIIKKAGEHLSLEPKIHKVDKRKAITGPYLECFLTSYKVNVLSLFYQPCVSHSYIGAGT